MRQEADGRNVIERGDFTLYYYFFLQILLKTHYPPLITSEPVLLDRFISTLKLSHFYD